jgi:hypothetical protein
MFEYDHSPSNSNFFSASAALPKFEQVIVQEYEDDPDKSECYVSKNEGIYEQRVKLLQGTIELHYMSSLRDMYMILNDGLEEN